MEKLTEEKIRIVMGWLVLLANFFFTVGIGAALAGFTGALVGLGFFFAILWIYAFIIIRKMKKEGMFSDDRS